VVIFIGAIETMIIGTLLLLIAQGMVFLVQC
jgi:hypothetical protein